LSAGRPYEEHLTDLQSHREKARLFGGKEAIDKLHQEGRMTARERIEALDLLSSTRTNLNQAAMVWPQFVPSGKR